MRRMFRWQKPTFHWRRHHIEFWSQTNISGYFAAFNVCTDVEQELFITKAGFVPTKKNATSLTLTTANVVAKLEIAGEF